MGTIRIRFVTSDDALSHLIRMEAGVSMPFTPSHAEALTQDGQFYIGAHLKGGILRRPVGYDADSLMTLPDGTKSERIVSLSVTPWQEAAFYAFVERHIGEGYDTKGILGYVVPDLHMHDFGHIFCSAFMAAALRAIEAPFFQWPLTKPFHRISPDILLAILSTHVEIPH